MKIIKLLSLPLLAASLVSCLTSCDTSMQEVSYETFRNKVINTLSNYHVDDYKYAKINGFYKDMYTSERIYAGNDCYLLVDIPVNYDVEVRSEGSTFANYVESILKSTTLLSSCVRLTDKFLDDILTKDENIFSLKYTKFYIGDTGYRISSHHSFKYDLKWDNNLLINFYGVKIDHETDYDSAYLDFTLRWLFEKENN